MDIGNTPDTKLISCQVKTVCYVSDPTE